MKKKFILAFFFSILLVLTSSCGLFDREKEEENPVNEAQMISQLSDDKMRNPAILQNDELLDIGDLEVEEKADIGNIQNPPTPFDKKMAEKNRQDTINSGYGALHHSWKYPQLHPVYVNPKIKALWGNYSENAIQYAWRLYGTPYVYGSDRSNPSSFDCSDYTRWVYLYTLGLDLPKTSRSQWEYVKKFSDHKYTNLSQAKRGDLLFFMNYKGWRAEDYKNIDVKSQPVGHVGIYLGNGQMLHTASAKTGGVRVDKLAGSHLQYRFVGGGTVIKVPR
jgi:peptidoglycan DL-endopeptidase CwlO